MLILKSSSKIIPNMAVRDILQIIAAYPEASLGRIKLDLPMYMTVIISIQSNSCVRSGNRS